MPTFMISARANSDRLTASLGNLQGWGLNSIDELPLVRDIRRRAILIHFYAPQLYRQVLLRCVLAMGILSVRLSATTRWYTKTR